MSRKAIRPWPFARVGLSGRLCARTGQRLPAQDRQACERTPCGARSVGHVAAHVRRTQRLDLVEGGERLGQKHGDLASRAD